MIPSLATQKGKSSELRVSVIRELVEGVKTTHGKYL